jgi:hypothetical protein
MKRLSLLGFVGLVSSVLAGCPIFNEERGGSGCDRDDDECGSWNSPSPGCNVPSDCGSRNETCGEDNQCHPGDCTQWGCSVGFSCVVDDENWTASCQPGASSGVGGAGGSGQGGSGAGGSDVVYCGNPADCGAGQTCALDGTCHTGDCTANSCIYGYTCGADGTCKPSNPAACAVDADCSASGAGYACVSGICTKPSDQCFDQTQCAAGNSCVAGKCTPSCASGVCPAGSGYACDTNLDICSKPVKSCTITNDCGGPSTVCVASACVPRSSGPTCPDGDVWVENGCIPSQSPTFTCKDDGKQDVCFTGSICLHHSCYISCDASSTVCSKLSTTFQECKPVTSSSGTHKVCGSKENLGGACDPTTGLACDVGKICIDGFCK